METFYSILGVSNTASLDEIKKKYRSLAKKYHPDRNKDAGASDMFKKISTAYETLKDPQKRSEYDESLLYHSSASRMSGSGYGDNYSQHFNSNFEDIFSSIFTANKKRQDQDINDILNGKYKQRENNQSNHFDFSSENMFRDPTEEEMRNNFFSWKREKRTQPESSKFKAVPTVTVELTLNECIEGTIRSVINEETGKEIRIRIPKGTTPENILKVKDPRIDIHIKPKFRKWKFIDGDVHLTVPIAKFKDKNEINIETILGEKLKVFKPANLKSGTKIRVKDKGWKKPSGERTNMIITFN